VIPPASLRHQICSFCHREGSKPHLNDLSSFAGPLSRSNQTRLLRSLNLRAAAGDVAAAEAVLRLGMLAQMQIDTATPNI
jgi:hypothetical protein